jgi:DNA (cytosine-5)-methyltransferase 1
LEHRISEDESGFLPTPVTLDTGSRFNRSQSEGAQLRPTLGAMARYNLWPTPTEKGKYNRRGVSSKSGAGLATTVSKFPTPTVATRKGSSIGALTRKDGRSRANDRLDYRIEGSGLTGRLNPEFVEWLMGWPIGWTALQPLEMGKFREWQRQHGDCSWSGVSDRNC